MAGPLHSAGSSDSGPAGSNVLTLMPTQLTGAGQTINLNLGATATNFTVAGGAGNNNQLIVQGNPPGPLTAQHVAPGVGPITAPAVAFGPPTEAPLLPALAPVLLTVEPNSATGAAPTSSCHPQANRLWALDTVFTSDQDKLLPELA